MYIEELHEALAGDRTAAIEHGFATLVAWPDYDGLFGSTSDVREIALVAACEALADNLAPIPPEVADRLEVVTGVAIARTYGAAACVVLASWPAFAEVVAQ